MIENLVAKKINKTFYQLLISDNEKSECIRLNLKDCYLPFGLEEYNNKLSINFEFENDEFKDLILLLEKNLLDLTDTEDLEVKSVFKRKKNYNLLCKSHIKKGKNVLITKYISENIEKSVYEIKSKNRYNLELEISGIWIYRNSIGIYLNLIKISDK